MDTAHRWVGLDVGESSVSICVFGDDEQPELETKSGPTAAEIAEALSCVPKDRIADVVLETGAEQGLAKALQRLGYPVTVVDAGKAQRFLGIRGNKTDRNDARGLADIARLGRSRYLSVWVRSAESEVIRSELVMRDQLVRQRTAIRSSLRAQLRRQGSGLTKIAFGKQYRSVIEGELDALAETSLPAAIAQLAPMLEVSETLSNFIMASDRRLESFAKANPVTRRFLAVPGVGPICAVSFYSMIEDPSRFSDTNAVGAYLGMVPKIKQSGTALRRLSISRAGNSMTRRHLYMSATVMLSRAAQKSAIGDWGKALAARRGYKVARMAVARKLALAMLSIWKKGGDFEPYPTRSRLPPGRGGLGLRSQT